MGVRIIRARWSLKGRKSKLGHYRGRRLAVLRSELGNRTRTTSPRRGLIIDGRLRTIPVFGEGLQPRAEIGRLGFVNAPSPQIHCSWLGVRSAQDRLELGLECFDLCLKLERPLPLLVAQASHGIYGLGRAHGRNVTNPDAVVTPRARTCMPLTPPLQRGVCMQRAVPAPEAFGAFRLGGKPLKRLECPGRLFTPG